MCTVICALSHCVNTYGMPKKSRPTGRLSFALRGLSRSFDRLWAAPSGRLDLGQGHWTPFKHHMTIVFPKKWRYGNRDS